MIKPLTKHDDIPGLAGTLRQIEEKPVAEAEALNPTTFSNPSAYEAFYRITSQEFFRIRVVKKVRSSRYTWCNGIADIPVGESVHIRGHLEGNRCYVGRTGSDDHLILQKVADCTFHSQPIDDVNSDIPSHEDIYDFLKFSHLRHIVVGKTKVSFLDKSLATLQLSLDLWDWESRKENAYKFQRMRNRHKEKTQQQIRNRYAKVVLSSIGLDWPSAAYAIRRDWPGNLRSFGILVTQHAAVPKRRPSDSVLMILANEVTADEAAKWHKVSTRKVGEWLRDFKAAGAAAIDK